MNKILQDTAISKHFTKSAEYSRTTSGTIFSADVGICGGQVIFQNKPKNLEAETNSSHVKEK